MRKKSKDAQIKQLRRSKKSTGRKIFTGLVAVSAILAVAGGFYAFGTKSGGRPQKGDVETVAVPQPEVQAPESDQVADASKKETAQDSTGKADYRQYCGACHGTSGEGASASALKGWDGGKEQFIRDTAGGVPGMPSYSGTLSEKRISDIADYVISIE
ncbi:MAG: c-type cytochrome [Candidatus Aquicultorales bacterium]